MFEGENWKPTVLQEMFWEYSDRRSTFFVQRDDRIHPIVSGNKSRKLLGWIHAYRDGNFEGIITFGGAYSNHLIATAEVCKDMGIPVLGLVRGDEGFRNPYLEYCLKCGMELIFVSRDAYRNKTALAQTFSGHSGRKNLIIPEGGMGDAGFLGFESLVDSWGAEIPDVLVHASATGTTAAGLVRALLKKGAKTQVFSVMVLKNKEEQQSHLIHWNVLESIHLVEGFDFGGYAKMPPGLWAFLEEVKERLDLPLEPIYTGKAFYALIHKILPENTGKKVCFLHTGGVFPPSAS